LVPVCILLLNRDGSITRDYANTGTIFFAAAGAVVALWMTVQSANVDVEPIRQDSISGRIHDPADHDPLDAGKY